MIIAVFASMGLALVAARWGPRWLAAAALLVCLAATTGEFLWEIYSPVDGFRLPWLQAELPTAMIPNGRPA